MKKIVIIAMAIFSITAVMQVSALEKLSETAYRKPACPPYYPRKRYRSAEEYLAVIFNALVSIRENEWRHLRELREMQEDQRRWLAELDRRLHPELHPEYKKSQSEKVSFTNARLSNAKIGGANVSSKKRIFTAGSQFE
ncbi:MAG: hypothetical protein WC707_00225 [Candidatus Babeliaceae bacterium]